ncbi:MAG: DUF1318 domain-containing protein [Candidatus Omnitrophica bacterium]|nr:DUF1318 domain-containing protein [Candidatus Omnitrophota bacterium]
MKRTVIAMLIVLIASVGCARVRVEAPKEPIKVDVSMRLDVYQHVVKDIDNIEDMVSGPAVGPQSRLPSFVGIAHADEGLGPDVENAAMRRKARRGDIASLEARGVLGESGLGMLEVRSASAGAAVEALVREENADRMVIYRGVAEKNGTSVRDVQKIYSQRLQRDAPGGTPIEIFDESTGRASWEVK